MTTELGSVLEAERQAVLTRVASSITHALGTPLNVIAGRATLIGMGLSSEEIAENARIIEQQVRNITAMLQQILRFARGGAVQVAKAEPRALLWRAAALVTPLAESRGMRVEVEAPQAGREERFAADAVVHVLIDVLTWAIDRLEAPAVLRLRASVGHAEPPPRERGRANPGVYARFELDLDELDIEDRSPEQIYEPWLHGDPSERSTALVMATAFGVAREQRGWAELSRLAAEPVRFVVCVPVSPAG